MLRRAFMLAVVLAATGIGVVPAHGEEDMRTAETYLQGLRERGYYDLADEFLEKLRADEDTPDNLRETIDYERGRLKLDEASKTGDLGSRKDLLDKARGDLLAFTEKHSKHPKAPEALVQLARLLVERGHLALIQSDEADDPKEKLAKTLVARESFDQARAAYVKADGVLSAAFKTYPPYLPENDPRRAERDRTHIAMMDAQLQKAVVDYEEGHTYKTGAKERADYLATGLTQFEDIYKRYRTQLAGLTARMFQGKCYEENGDLGKALGIYNELLEHQDPRLRPLQRHIGYFKIIATRKRKEYALAADLATAWLQRFNTNDEHRSREGLGVQLELAKAILDQVPEANERDRPTMIRRVVDIVTQVVRIPSPAKPEALEILKKYKPKAAQNAENLGKMGFDELMGQGEEALNSQEWDKAITAFKLAIRKADPTKDPDKANMARYELAICYYKSKHYYEALVIADHLARRYPRFSMAAEATKIGMASLADAYNTYRDIDRNSDLTRLVDFCLFTKDAFPDKDVGDVARMTLGQIYHGIGQYPKAIAIYESVKPKSQSWNDAQTKLGASHWEQSQVLRRKGDNTGADAEVAKALATLNAALKARQDAGTVLTDSDLINNACDIGEIELEIGKSAEALALLDPIVKAQKEQTGPAFSRLMAQELRAHIAVGQVELALADMAVLEKAEGGTSLAQLYFSLGKLLEKEMQRLRDKGDSGGLARKQAEYQKFLGSLVKTKSGQTYDSLEWAGENMLKLSNYKEAGAVLQRVLDTFGKDKAFLNQPGSGDRLFRSKIKLSESLRGQREYSAAEELVKELKAENPKMLDPLIEEGHLLEDKAASGQEKGGWAQSYNHWRRLALRLQGMRPKPAEYYDAWYHAAYALSKDGQGKLAAQTLNGVLRLSPKLSGEDMKKKYADLLAKLK